MSKLPFFTGGLRAAFVRLAALLTFLIAGVVLTGWFSHSAILVRILPSYSPMKPMAALCLLLSAIALLLLEAQRPRMASCCAAVAAIIPLLTLAEYALDLDFGFDTLISSTFLPGTVRYAARMAPNTACALAVLDMILVYCGGRALATSERAQIGVALSGSFVFALGVVPLIGYMGGLTTAHTLGPYAGMSLPTSLCLILMGISLVVYAWKQNDGLPSWLFIPVAMGFVVVSLSMWQAIRAYEDARFATDLQDEADYIAMRTNDSLNGFYGAMDRLGDRWQAAGGTPRLLWEADAGDYLKSYPYLQAIAWVDATGATQWVVPAPGAQIIDLTAADTRGKAQATRVSQVTAATDLAQGGKAFIHVDPLYIGDRFDGWMMAVFTLDEIFKNILDDRNGAYALTVTEDGAPVYSNAPAGYQPPARWRRQAVIHANDHDLSLTLGPGPGMLARRSAALSDLVLAAGLLMSLFATVTVLLAFRWQRDAIDLRNNEERLHQVIGVNAKLNVPDFVMQDFLIFVVEQIRLLVPTDGAVIEMIEADEIVFGAASGILSSMKGKRIKQDLTFAGLCVKTSEVVVSHDVLLDQRPSAVSARNIGIRSAVAVPLIQHGTIVGVIGVSSIKAHVFRPEHISTLYLLGGLVGGALGREIEIERRRKMEDDLRQIIAINSALNTPDFHMQDFMNLVVERLRDLVPATGAVIEMMDGDDMVYDAVSGTLAPFRGTRIPRQGSLTGLSVATGEVLIAHDTMTDARVNAEACRKVGAMSAVVVPLRQRGRVIGVLKIVATKANIFSEKDIGTLQLMAGLVGGALGQEIEIDRRRKLEEELRHMAHIDPLTGLPNRALFHDRLSQAIINNQRNGKFIAVIYMDIDHFKGINDAYGHAEGDALLRQFSQRVQKILRKGDTLARMGGDEFIAIAENLRGSDDARLVAEKIIAAIGEEFDLPNLRLKIGASLGVAVSDQPDLIGAAIVERADEALYEVKRAGRHNFKIVQV